MCISARVPASRMVCVFNNHTCIPTLSVITRDTVTAKPASRRQPPPFRRCHRSAQTAIAAVKPGARIHDVSRAVYGYAVAHGYGVVRQYCGHGVGFSPHEDPQIPNYVSPGPNPRIVPGMVLAIEPMINLGTGDVRLLDDDWTVVTLDRKISAHYEHTVAVLEDRVEVLTSWPSP